LGSVAMVGVLAFMTVEVSWFAMLAKQWKALLGFEEDRLALYVVQV